MIWCCSWRIRADTRRKSHPLGSRRAGELDPRPFRRVIFPRGRIRVFDCQGGIGSRHQGRAVQPSWREGEEVMAHRLLLFLGRIASLSLDRLDPRCSARTGRQPLSTFLLRTTRTVAYSNEKKKQLLSQAKMNGVLILQALLPT